MFTLPPLPPKDYVLKEVNQNQGSSQEFTPDSLPRITQNNLRKFCAPIHYQENEKFSGLDIDFSVNPKLLDKWVDNARAFWVDKPGKNDYFLHDIFKKYSVQVMPSYDSRFKHNERVFYRSFKYELECLEFERLKRLYRKMAREEKQENVKTKMREEKSSRNVDMMGVKACKDISPFWWPKPKESEIDEAKLMEDTEPEIVDPSDMLCSRWQQEPDLMEYKHTDPCKRRYDMALYVD